MDPLHKKTLQKKRKTLVDHLEPDKLLDYLLSEDVFDKADYDKIRSFTTREEQSRQLLDVLVLRGSTAYPCFLQALKNGKAKDLAEELEKQECELQRSVTTTGIQATESSGKCDWQRKEPVWPVPESGATGKPQIAKKLTTKACSKSTDKLPISKNLTPEAADKTESAKQLTPEAADVPQQSVNKLTAMFENINTGKNTTDEARKHNRSCTQRQNPSGGGTGHQPCSTMNTTKTADVNISIHMRQSSVTQIKYPPDDSKEEPSSSDSFPEDIEPQVSGATSSERPTGVQRMTSSPYPPAQSQFSSQGPIGIQRMESSPYLPSQAPYPVRSGPEALPYNPAPYTVHSGPMALPSNPALYRTGSGPMAHPGHSAPYPTDNVQMPQPRHPDQPPALGFELVASDVTSNLPATVTLHPAGYNQSQIPDNNIGLTLNLPPPSFP